jgi:hypothetical protein
MAGSGDKQPIAKLCRVEIDEVAVAFGPPGYHLGLSRSRASTAARAS